MTFITFVQDLKKKTKAWEPLLELCANGEKTLERFRYQFPDDWLYSDQLKGEWSAYNEILKRKNDSIQEQLGGLTGRDEKDAFSCSWVAEVADLFTSRNLTSGPPTQDRRGGQNRREQDQ